MNTKKMVIVLSILLVSLLFCVGCSKMSLRYTKPPVESMNKGKISVVVNDNRPSDKTGGNLKRIGTIRNTFGMPFPLEAGDGREPPKVIKELFSDCLEAAGYEVLEPSETVPKLFVNLNSFWSDGYQYSRMWITTVAELKRDVHSDVFWKKEIESSTGVTWKVGYGPFNKAFNKLLEDMKIKLITIFEGPEFFSSVKSFQ